MAASLTGGCQCGAVRFRAGRLGSGSICHCRMCQKQFGGFYGPLVSAFEVVWTRGAPKLYRSSNLARRGFCADCGTPLSYQADGVPAGEVELAIGAFDDPLQAAPIDQLNPEDKLSIVDSLHLLHMRTPDEDAEQEDFKRRVISYQHPDHDTPVWPPEER